MKAELSKVYISPRGKRCVLVPGGAGRVWPWLQFRYPLSGGGFTLTHANFRFMREAAQGGTHAATR